MVSHRNAEEQQQSFHFHFTCLVLSLQPRGGGEGHELLSALADCLFVHPVEYPRAQGHIRVGGGGVLRAISRFVR